LFSRGLAEVAQMSDLRQEIIEAQKMRAEILKWKLILVAALGAVGLGFSHPESVHVPNAYLVLLLVPLVCFYVDLLCKHMSLRMIVIGTFLRSRSSNADDAAYERFVSDARAMGPRRTNVFAFEEWALDGSTAVLSLLVVLVGLVPSSLGISISTIDEYLFIGSGVSGLLLTLMVRFFYKRRLAALERLAQIQAERSAAVSGD
jgi:hypothetical protein